MLDFPNSPTVGQIFNQWRWDGGKWGPTGASPVTSVAAGTGLTASPSPIVATGTMSLTTPVSIANGGTNATTAGAALANLGGISGNQSITLSGDITGSGTTAIPATLATVNSNVGTFQGLTLDAKGRVTAAANQSYAPLASPVFTGDPRAPTPATADNDTSIATTGFVKAQGYFPTAGGTIGGNVSIAGPGDQVLALSVPNTANCIMTLTVASVRTWQQIVLNSGNFAIYDTSTPRLQILVDGTCQNTTGTWSAISDASLKQNVVDYTSGLAQVVQLRPVTFGWRDEVSGPSQNWGLIAQEVEPVMPELVGETSAIREGEEPIAIKTVDYGRIIFSVINSLREISQRLDSIEARLAALEVA